MKQPATRELFDYWNCLRGDRAAPDRAEIDPAAIRNVLADTFMLEVDADHRFPIRLSGSRFNALFCCEKKGHSFLDMWSAEEARKIAAVLLTVVDAACPLIAEAAAAPEGYPEQKFELLFLPLRHGGESKARILGSLSLLRKPAWLGLLPVDELSLKSLQKVDGTASIAATPKPLRPALPVPHGGADFETRGHLRVFRGGR
ncbi:MAG: PAS domain-containing protein [Beijerinckiaceae bacterium]